MHVNCQEWPGVEDIHVRVDTMLVIEVGRRTEAFDRVLDSFAGVRRVTCCSSGTCGISQSARSSTKSTRYARLFIRDVREREEMRRRLTANLVLCLASDGVEDMPELRAEEDFGAVVALGEHGS